MYTAGSPGMRSVQSPDGTRYVVYIAGPCALERRPNHGEVSVSGKIIIGEKVFSPMATRRTMGRELVPAPTGEENP